MRYARIPGNERGVTLALMAVLLFLALGMGALAIDYGMIKSAKAEAQRAMDSAALAGASAFLEPNPSANKDSIARARAHELANQHLVRLKRITNAEVVVTVDLTKFTVKTEWSRPDLRLWFASIFGSRTMGLAARATAQAVNAGTSRCIMPAALPDLWNNVEKTVRIQGKTVQEDPNNNGLWDYTDKSGGNGGDPNRPGVVDPGEWEPWEFDPGSDTYDSTSTGLGTTYRQGLDTKIRDYGRQIL